MSDPISLDDYLRIHKKQFIRIRGDGNCLFNAFSYRLTGSQRSWQKIKDAEIDLLKDKGDIPDEGTGLRDDFGADTFRAYLNSSDGFKKPGYNGRDIDAYILSKIFKLKLTYVYYRYAESEIYGQRNEVENAALNILCGFNVRFENFTEQIFLVVTGSERGGHYDLLVPASQSSPQTPQKAPRPLAAPRLERQSRSRLLPREAVPILAPLKARTAQVIEMCKDREVCVLAAEAHFGDIIETYEDAVLFNIFYSETA